MFDYLKTKKDFVGTLLHHIGTSAIMDLLLRLITCIESSETKRAVVEVRAGSDYFLMVVVVQAFLSLCSE